MKRYFLLCLFLLGLVYVKGQDGTLDSAFAEKGWTSLNFFGKGNYAQEDAIKLFVKDNRNLVIYNMGNGVLIGRYFSDGRLDTTYSDKGFSDFAYLDEPTAAALQLDGKIVVAGRFVYYDSLDQYHSDFSLVRYTENGSVDSSFGTNGKSNISFGGDAYARAVTAQNDGKIVVAGEFYNDTSNTDFAVARLNGNGSMDSTFNGNGKQTISFFNRSYDNVKAISILDDNRILIAGSIYDENTYNQDIGLACYKVDGSLDSSFGNNGLVITNITNQDLPDDMILQPDGKIIVGGNGFSSAYMDFELVRYNSTGSLDSSFGSGGIVLTDFDGDYDFGTTLGLLENGKIVFGGSANAYDSIITGYVTSFGFARYLDNGALDSTFGSDGKVTVGIGNNPIVESLDVLADQKILALGKFEGANGSDLALVQMDSTGSLDSSFNETGIMIFYYPTYTPASFSSIAVQNDGKIIVGGTTMNPEKMYSEFALARYNINGTLDPDFGNDGIVTTDFGNWAEGSSVDIQSDGKILLAGSARVDYYDNFALARYNTDGSPDSSFGNDGKVMTYFEYMFANANDIGIQNDGKIVLAGEIAGYDDYTYDIALARYNQDGTLDSSGFGISGKVITDFEGDQSIYSIIILNDGKIMGAGYLSIDYQPEDFLLIRYNSNGSIDSSFSDDGVVNTDFGGYDYGYDIKLTSKGYLVGGTSYDRSTDNSDFALASYDSTGRLNADFGTGGIVTTDFGGKEIAFSISLQTDGKFILTGRAESNYNSPVIARYDSTGQLDPDFGTGGKLTNDFGYPSYFRSSAWNAGKLYTSGILYVPFSESGLLASYNANAEIQGPPVISINDVTVYENAGTANLTISLNKSSHPALTINYQTRDGSAVSKGKSPDYKSAKGTVTIPDGSTSAQISITIKTDKANEGPENFYVDLSLSRRMSDKAIIGDTTGVVTILNVSGLLDELTEANNLQVQAESTNTLFSAKVLPNPSTGYFTLKLESKNNVPMSINVVDASGRLVEALKGIAPNSSLQLGSNYHAGIYYVHILQGNEKLTLKLIKE